MVNRQVLTLDEFTIREMKAFPKAHRGTGGLLRDAGGKGLRSI